jgi:hypothetical protein
MSGESSSAGDESESDAESRRQHAPMDAAPELFDPAERAADAPFR